MGCMKSKIRNEETVNRSMERKQYMKRAATAPNNFTAAHSAHAKSLKQISAALIDYVHGVIVYPSGVGGGGRGDASLPPPLRPFGNKDDNVPRSTRSEGKKKGRPSNTNLLQLFVDIGDCFVKSSDSAHDISRLLETTCSHYHPNFTDKRGVMHITWNRSFKGIPDAADGVNNFDSEKLKTHAAVLDKMLVWEEKLYDEVKASEQMKLKYQKNVVSLNKLMKHGSNIDVLKKMTAGVSHLHTRYIVDLQSMDSIVSEINSLRDDQLYPKLVTLVDAMATMWDTMKTNHEKQSKIVRALSHLDISQSPIETSEYHHERTRQLCDVVHEWHSHFSELMSQQKEYIKALNNWVKLNLIPIDKNLKEEVLSPRGTQNPPIKALLQTWDDYLEKIPDEPMQYTITNFAAVIHTIWLYQKEELHLKKKCEESREELRKRTREFDNWCKHYRPRRIQAGKACDEDLISGRRQHVEAAKLKLKGDKEAYQRQCNQVRQMSVMSLKSNLPVLFKALSDFSLACWDMYSNLKSFAPNQRTEVMVD